MIYVWYSIVLYIYGNKKKIKNKTPYVASHDIVFAGSMFKSLISAEVQESVTVTVILLHLLLNGQI